MAVSNGHGDAVCFTVSLPTVAAGALELALDEVAAGFFEVGFVWRGSAPREGFWAAAAGA